MLFGNPAQFAIEAMLEPGIQPPSSVWGRMRVWCQGISLGDFTDPCCALYPSYVGFRDMSAVLSTLWRREFDGLTDLELTDKLDLLLYGYRGDEYVQDARSVEDCQRDWAEYGQHVFLTHWGEQFDRTGKAFVFSRDAASVVILVRVCGSSVDIRRLETTREDFCAAVFQFTRWFDEMAERLAGHDTMAPQGESSEPRSIR